MGSGSSFVQPSSVSSTLPSTRTSRCFNSTTAEMSDMKASVTETKKGFHVEGYEKIEYDFSFIDGVFDKQKGDLAECFSRWRRCLAVMDMNIYNVYGKQMQEYFEHHGRREGQVDRYFLEHCGLHDRIRYYQKGTSSSCRRRTGHRRCWICLCCLPTQHELHPYPHDRHWSDRRLCLDQGRRELWQLQEPPRRLPRTAAHLP